jgi:hypothetical protein
MRVNVIKNCKNSLFFKIDDFTEKDCYHLMNIFLYIVVH